SAVCLGDSIGIQFPGAKSSLFLLTQCDHGRAPAPGFERRVSKCLNIRGLGENGAHHFTLYSDSPAMDDPQSLESQAVSLFEVFFHDRFDIPRRNHMQIKDIRDWNAYGFFVLLHYC